MLHKTGVLSQAELDFNSRAALDSTFDVTTIGELEALATKATDFAGKKAFRAKAKELALATGVAKSIRDLLTNAAITAQGITDAKDIDPDIYDDSGFADEFKRLLTTHAASLASHKSEKLRTEKALAASLETLTNTLQPAFDSFDTEVTKLKSINPIDFSEDDASLPLFDAKTVVGKKKVKTPALPTMSLADAREAAFNALIGKATIRNGNLDAAVSAATSDAEKIAIYRKMAGLTA